MIPPEVLHVLFTAAGLLLGWYLKHQSGKLPPEVQALVGQLLARRQEQQARDLLHELLGTATPPPPPSAKS
jgi:hypothetical protein